VLKVPVALFNAVPQDLLHDAWVKCFLHLAASERL
jgi:hypothetical protein